jgi:hypothetical protein
MNEHREDSGKESEDQGVTGFGVTEKAVHEMRRLWWVGIPTPGP